MSPFDQVGAKMGKSTRSVYWGRAVKTGRTDLVGDMLKWALWVTPTVTLKFSPSAYFRAFCATKNAK